MNGTQPGRQEGARRGSGRGGSKSPLGRGRRVPRADGRSDDRAACQGEEVQGVYMRVVKNTLARKALAGTSFESVGPKLKGPLVLAFSKDDPGAAARVVKDFAKANEKLVATLVSLGGQVLPARSSTRWRVCRLASRRCRCCSASQGADPEVRRARSPNRRPSSHAPFAAVRDQKQAAGA